MQCQPFAEASRQALPGLDHTSSCQAMGAVVYTTVQPSYTLGTLLFACLLSLMRERPKATMQPTTTGAVVHGDQPSVGIFAHGGAPHGLRCQCMLATPPSSSRPPHPFLIRLPPDYPPSSSLLRPPLVHAQGSLHNLHTHPAQCSSGSMPEQAALGPPAAQLHP